MTKESDRDEHTGKQTEPLAQRPRKRRKLKQLYNKCVTNAGPRRYAVVEKSPPVETATASACSVSGLVKAKSAIKQLCCECPVTCLHEIAPSS